MQSNDGVAVLAGNQIPEGALPPAEAYAAHQFGHFTTQSDEDSKVSSTFTIF